MPRPSLGSVQVKIVVDKPRKTYYGWDDPVTGIVSLLWQPNTGNTASQELFGPLQLDLRLEGYQQSDLYVTDDPWEGESGNTRCLEERKLCFETVDLHNGAIKIAPQQGLEFPFQVCFPGSVCAATTKQPRGKYTTRYAGNLLPPTMRLSTRVGSSGGTTEVLYFVSCEALMEGIDVGFTPKQDSKQVLKYGGILETGPDPGVTSLWPQRYLISNKSLLPKDERPSIFSFSKKKAALPTFSFSLLISSVPKQVVLGEALKFSISVILHPNDTTASFIPAINLERCKVMLVRNTVLENDKTKTMCGIIKLDGDSEVQLDVLRPPEVLTKGSPNREKRYVHNCRTKAVMGIPSVNTDDIKVSYTVKFELRATIGKDTVKLDSKHEIDILGTRPLPTFEASVSDRKGSARPAGEQLPVYSKEGLQTTDAERWNVHDYPADTKALDAADRQDADMAGPSKQGEEGRIGADTPMSEIADEEGKAKG